eukprot:g71490.t1
MLIGAYACMALGISYHIISYHIISYHVNTYSPHIFYRTFQSQIMEFIARLSHQSARPIVTGEKATYSYRYHSRHRISHYHLAL